MNQYTGDGIMALFGAPIAHEDHAQRACYAALHLRDRLRQYADELRLDPGVNFSFRIGLNSGEVMVGKIGDDLRMDYTAQGHTVGLAQRMEQLAPPDGIALSQHTQKPIDGFFALRVARAGARSKGCASPSASSCSKASATTAPVSTRRAPAACRASSAAAPRWRRSSRRWRARSRAPDASPPRWARRASARAACAPSSSNAAAPAG